jgi:hypothetical protein
MPLSLPLCAPASGAIKAVEVRFREKFTPGNRRDCVGVIPRWGATEGERPVRRITNLIRRSVLGEPASDERSPKRD